MNTKKRINSCTIADMMQDSVHLYLKLLNIYIKENNLYDEPLQQVLDCLDIDSQNANETDINYLVKRYIQYV